jgi:hypothetical protein
MKIQPCMYKSGTGPQGPGSILKFRIYVTHRYQLPHHIDTNPAPTKKKRPSPTTKRSFGSYLRLLRVVSPKRVVWNSGSPRSNTNTIRHRDPTFFSRMDRGVLRHLTSGNLSERCRSPPWVYVGRAVDGLSVILKKTLTWIDH